MSILQPHSHSLPLVIDIALALSRGLHTLGCGTGTLDLNVCQRLKTSIEVLHSHGYDLCRISNFGSIPEHRIAESQDRAQCMWTVSDIKYEISHL